MTIRIDGTNTAANPGITGTDTDTGLQFGTDEVNIVTGGSTRATVDSSGRLLVGTSTARSGWFNTTVTAPLIQSETTGLNVFSGVQNSANALGPWMLLGKSRGSSAGAVTVVQNNDQLGSVSFQGADGAEMVEGAKIQAFVDGTPGSNDMPGRLVFSTTADGASSPTERMRLDSSGNLRFNSGYGSVATAYGVRAWVHFQGTSTVTIAGSGNVSSITDRGTGQYTVGFTTALVNNNYAVCGTATSTGNTDNSYTYNVIYYDYGTTGVKVATYDNGQRLDYTVISMAVVR